MNPDLSIAYKSAAAAVARSHSNFSYSFLVLPREKRRAFCAVYAFMRSCDDASDGDDSDAVKRDSLRTWRSRLEPECAEYLQPHSFLPAFRDTLQKFSIPEQYFHWIIDGTEMDLDTRQYETFDDLYRYCFHVASAVGLVCLQIFGYQKEEAARAQKLAEQCGIAFQLTNILRDIKEDAERGRIYLPMEDLQRFGYTPEDVRRGILDERFRKLMHFEAERARGYYREARRLLPLVEPSSRPALWAMMEIYERILERIIRNGFDVFHGRIRLSTAEKLAVACQALALRLVRRRK